MNQKIPSSEITPEHHYLSRRRFLKVGLLTTAGLALAACTPKSVEPAAQSTGTPISLLNDEFGDPATSFETITTYNNFYEFSTNKSSVAYLADKFMSTPWQIQVGGLVRNPGNTILIPFGRNLIRRNAFIECDVWKVGRWSSRGPGFHWQSCSNW